MTISPYLVAVAVGWIIAQGAKYTTAAVKARSLHVFDRLYLSGNMPSAHSATVVSIATLIALRDGIDSRYVRCYDGAPFGWRTGSGY